MNQRCASALLCLLATTLGGSALAQSPEEILAEQESAAAVPVPGAWWERDTATGDWLGARTALEERGLELFGGYTAEVWGSSTGSVAHGALFSGLLDLGANLDLERLVGWQGASLSTTWFLLSGEDASEDLLGNLMTVSNIAGFPTVRMYEAWLQQSLLDGAVSVRLGQLAADSEFVVSDSASLFLNSTFGWPASLYANLPEGSPSYPMGTLGVRLAVRPIDDLTFQSAVFQGDPFAQDVGRHGFRPDLDEATGTFWINEAQLRWNHQEDASGQPGQLEGGFWLHSADFASPDESADDIHQSNYGLYFVLDQRLYREAGAAVSAAPAATEDAVAPAGEPDAESSCQGLSWFGRIAFSPQDRNVVGFYFDTGLTYTGLVPSRDDDTIGVAFAYAQLTSGARRALDGEGFDPAGAEMVIEAIYQCQLTPWLALAPDLQLILDPGATQDSGNAFVAGLRASIAF